MISLFSFMTKKWDNLLGILASPVILTYYWVISHISGTIDFARGCTINTVFNIDSLNNSSSRICAIFGVQIYSDIYSLNMFYPNISEYSFGTLNGIRIYLDFSLCPYHDIRSSLVPLI